MTVMDNNALGEGGIINILGGGRLSRRSAGRLGEIVNKANSTHASWGWGWAYSFTDVKTWGVIYPLHLFQFVQLGLGMSLTLLLRIHLLNIFYHYYC